MKTYKVMLIVTVFFTVLGLLIRCHMRNVPVVLVGPIDPSLDTVGPISKGMTRKQVIGMLGSPLRPRGKGTGRDSVGTDYFSGIYAEVGWTLGDRAASVGFPFARFEGTYSADFRVVLRLSDRDVVLSRKLNWSDAQHLWKNKRTAPPNPRIIKGNHVINIVYSEKEYVSLDFSTADGKLNHVVYVF
jgi:hypothetical protein